MNEEDTGLKDMIKTAEEDLEDNLQSQKDATATRRDENQAYQNDITTIVKGEEALKGAIAVLSEFYKSLEKHNEADDDDDFLQLNHAKHAKHAKHMKHTRHTKRSNTHEDPSPPEIMEDEHEGQSSNEVIDLLEEIYESTKAQEARAHEDEEQDQHDYEDSMTEIKGDEADLRKSITTLTKNLEDARKKMEMKHEELTRAEKEKMQIEQYVDKIKPGCDFVVDKFDDREANRETEKTALQEVHDKLKASPVYANAEREAKEAGMGDCKKICLADEANAKCKACLAGVSVPGYCAGHSDTPGC